MKIVIIGHPCLDIIHKDNLEERSFGGILYSLVGFYLVAQKDDEIIPAFQIKDEYKESYFSILPRDFIINKKLISLSHDVNIVHLFFEKENLQFECYQNVSKKFDVNFILSNVDKNSHFYINMISGFELDLYDLFSIRNYSQGKIYLDFHTLTRGIDENGKRFFRPLDDWLEWIACCDVIQLNEIERENLSPLKLTEEEFAIKALEAGTEVVNITKGKDGAISYYKNGDDLKSYSAKPQPNLQIKNIVGCGDIFGSVFAYNYFANNDIYTCLEKAVYFSSKRVEYESLQDYIKIKNYL